MIKKNILKKLQEYNLGLTRNTLGFSKPEHNFQESYKFLAHMLNISVSNIKTHHIGSTAIPGLIAKPILDILLVYQNTKDFSRQIPKIENLGFSPRGQNPYVEDCLSFNFYNDEHTIDYAHVHAVKLGHPNIGELLLFRDKLLGSPKLVAKYTELKLNLLQSGINRKDYTGGAKTAWILNTLKSSL